MPPTKSRRAKIVIDSLRAIGNPIGSLPARATKPTQRLTNTDPVLLAAEERAKTEYDTAVANLFGPVGAEQVHD